jgi:hypothetical protein
MRTAALMTVAADADRSRKGPYVPQTIDPIAAKRLPVGSENAPVMRPKHCEAVN